MYSQWEILHSYVYSQLFSSAITFGADSVDPLLVSTQFLFTLTDFHIFGCKLFDLAVHRTFKKEVAFHTSVYVVNKSQVGRLVECTWRRRPNGVDIQCCNKLAKYMANRSRKGMTWQSFSARKRRIQWEWHMFSTLNHCLMLTG